MSKTRSLLRGILLVLFVIAIYNSVDNLLSNDTGISVSYGSEDCPLPVISICPGQSKGDLSSAFKQGNNKTFQNFLEWSKENSSFFLPQFSEVWAASGETSKNISFLKMVDDLVAIQDNHLEKCIRLKFEYFPFEEDFSVSLIIFLVLYIC